MKHVIFALAAVLAFAHPVCAQPTSDETTALQCVRLPPGTLTGVFTNSDVEKHLDEVLPQAEVVNVQQAECLFLARLTDVELRKYENIILAYGSVRYSDGRKVVLLRLTTPSGQGVDYMVGVRQETEMKGGPQ